MTETDDKELASMMEQMERENLEASVRVFFHPVVYFYFFIFCFWLVFFFHFFTLHFSHLSNFFYFVAHRSEAMMTLKKARMWAWLQQSEITKHHFSVFARK